MRKALTIAAGAAAVAVAVFAVVFFVAKSGNGDGSRVPAEGRRSSPAVQPADLPTTPEHDKDEDGILDEEEARLGTSDVNFDSDGDGLLDADEVNTYGTDPVNPDTDSDGFWDGFEIQSGYNPKGDGKL